MMKKIGILISLFAFLLNGYAQTKTIHVYVALCDNENQGIVPVPEHLGNGKDSKSNLYWGALYGVKSFFKYKTKDWKLIQSHSSTSNPNVLEQIVFKHATQDVYLLAEAYDGEEIKTCIEDFLLTSNHQNPMTLEVDNKSLNFGGRADLIAYVGHDGLMDFVVDITYKDTSSPPKDVMILACYSQEYFSPEIKKANANPLLWTTHLMAPEAYTLKAAIDGWLKEESGKDIDERAAQAYNQYQKCGLKGARNLFTTEFKN